MKKIRIDIGVYTALDIDLSAMDFEGIKEVIFTVKNYPTVEAPEIIERVFTEPKAYEIVVTPEESLALKTTAEYDLSAVLADGKKFKLTNNGKIELRKAVGDCIDN